MEIGIEEIQTDIQSMEEDVKKINCSAICDLISHSIKCITDYMYYFAILNLNNGDTFQRLNYFYHHLNH